MPSTEPTPSPPPQTLLPGRAFLPLSALACLAALGILFCDCLGASKSIYGRDTTAHDYGMLLWGWGTMLSTGRLPLWNPCLFGGVPTLGSFALCPFTPSSVFFALTPFPPAFTFQYLFAFVAGGTGMALLAHRLGLGAAPALAAGLVFALSGHMTTLAYAGHLTKALALCWVPWLFAAAEQWRRRKGWGSAAAMAVALGLMLTASHFQVAYLAVLFLAVWALWTAAEKAAWRQPRLAVRMGLQLACAVALAGALGAAQVAPGLEMAPLSNRAGGVPEEEAARTSYPPKELLEYVVPGWLGASTPGARGAYRGSWGAPNGERIVSDYFGVVALALAIIALARSQRRSKWLWAAMALGGIWIGVGKWTPLLHWLRAGLPGFDHFRSPAVAMGWTTIGGVVLAAMGLECALAPRPASPKHPDRVVVAWIVIALGLAATAMVLRLAAPTPATDGFGSRTIPAANRDAYWARFLLFSATAYALSVLAVGATLASLGAWLAGQRGPRGRAQPWLVAAWIALLAVDTGWRSRDYVLPLDYPDYMRYLERITPAEVRDDADQPVRIVQRDNELLNAFMLSGVGTIHGYHPIVYERYSRVIQTLGFFKPATAALFHQNWLLWRGDKAPSPDWRAVESAKPKPLWERSPRTPYVFFPPRWVSAGDEREAVEQLARGDFSPQGLGIVEGRTDLEPSAAEGGASARVIGYGANEVEFEADVAVDRAAVFADVMAPGWTLRRLGGQGRAPESIEPFHADVAFRGAVLPAGSGRYVWRYEPFSFRLGMFVSLLAWGGLAGFVLGRRRRNREIDTAR